MSWRKHENHRAETKAVKAALKAAGVEVQRVGHDTGTAWGWLHIKLPRITSKHRVNDDRNGNGMAVQELTCAEMGCERIYYTCILDCPACQEYHARHDKVLAIAQEVTGRHGDYNGEISISD